MKNIKYLNIIGVFVLALFFACEPFEDVNPDAGLNLPPAESEMDFSITPGDDAFHFNVQITSPTLNGISQVSFDFGNGTKVIDESGVAYYPLPDDYTITLTVKTNAGSSTISKTHTTTETDYSLFTDPIMIMLSGGIENTEGKSWVVDSLTTGHFGIGPPSGNWPEWWSAGPLAKPGSGAYDDEFVIKLEGFSFAFNNNGNSYVKDYRKDNPNYSNPVELYGEPDCRVDYNPAPVSWSIQTKEDGDYIVLNSTTPAFWGFDYGAVNSEYRIEELTDNFLHVSCIGGDGNRWYNMLIPKGYERPSIEWEMSVTEGTEINSYDVAFNITNLPAGESIEKFVVDFGDGNVVETTDKDEVISGTYMRAGNYSIKTTAVTSLGELVATELVTVENHHPDYEEFILDEIVMYNDFSEIEMAPVNGENCFVAVDDNPDRTYPNKSSRVAFYSKTNNEWANANMLLPSGYRFDLRNKSVVKLKVYGKAGDVVLLKFENTDRGGNAWQTGAEINYTIQQDNTWEVVDFDFAGVGAGWDWTGDQFTSDITTDDRFNHGFYDIIRIMLNPGVGDGTHEFYFDELAGPHVEGIKSANIK